MSSQVTVVSTTDTPEDVTKAQGMYSKKSEVETKPAPEAEKPQGETKAAASEAPEVETQESEVDTDDEGDGEDTVAQGTQLNAGQPKKKGGFQKKIDKLTKERTLAAQERDYWREQAMRYQKTPDTQTQAPVETKKTVETDPEPNPDNFTSVAEYMKAVSKWTLAQDKKAAEAERRAAEAAQKAEAAKAEFQKKETSFREKVQAQMKVAPDLQEVFQSVDHLTWGPQHMDVIYESEHGAQIMYDLAKNPQEYERLTKLSPVAFAKEMGKLEAKFDTPATAKTTTEAKTTRAPRPIAPVSKGAITSTKSPDEMNYAEYKAWREAGGGA